MIDQKGKVRQKSKVDPQSIDKFEPVNKNLLEKNEGATDGCIVEPQFILKSSTQSKKASSVHFIAEADNHGLFEIRFHRLTHVGDRENSDTFASKQIAIDRAMEEKDV